MPSTMDIARQLARAGAGHGTVVVAASQTGGRGRGGRVWASPPGNLYATILLRPGGELRRAPELGFVMALAAAEAADQLAGPGTRLKWPNDLLREGAKLAGILLEALEDGAVLAGLGMNVRHAPPGMPYPVTCLAALGCDAAPETVLHAVLHTLSATWAQWQRHGLAPVLASWRQRGPALGDAVRVRLGDAVVDGTFAGLDPSGALLLQTPAGPRTIVAGEVVLPAS